MTINNIVLVIPYEMKDEAKERKCSWDSENKYWYVPQTHVSAVSNFIQNYIRVDLTNSNFDDKDEIKKHGGKWDPKEKVWYTYKGNEKLQKFMKYSDTSEATKEKVKKEKKAKKDERDGYKKDYLANGGTEDEFGRWYSVNILNHE